MKNLLSLSWLLALVLLVGGCEDRMFIDPVSAVDPGPDATAPTVTITSPVNASSVQVLEAVTDVDIAFEVVDDIEIEEIAIDFDGNRIATYTEFTDFRRVVETFNYGEVTDGEHTITVTATDLSGKTTSSSVTFSKEPAYTPEYAGETLYMPFDGNYIDLVNIERATVVGNPGFSETAVAGTGAYAGAEGAYLTYPTDGLLGEELSAVFWMQVNATPDRAGVLVIGPPDPNNPDNANNRDSGFRFFRENAGGEQRFKLNIGTGGAQTWLDGGEAADVVPDDGEWHHFAITMTANMAAVYIDGQAVSQAELPGPVDWSGTDVLSIMSGAPRFVGWNHRSDRSLMDELRFFNRGLTAEEVGEIFVNEGGSPGSGYTPEYEGEQFFLSFDEGEFTEQVSGRQVTVVGTPNLSEEAVEGMAYEGTEGAYLTFPAAGLLSENFSASMWYRLNATPDRAGILVIGPPDAANPDAANNRTSGLRFFREAAGEDQRFKLNVGGGEADSWFDGGEMADIPATSTEWHHLAFSIAGGSATVYIDGEVAVTREFDGIDWTGVETISIMSGAPNFVGWNHRSDQSLLDELRLFNKALTPEEVQRIMND